MPRVAASSAGDARRNDFLADAVAGDDRDLVVTMYSAFLCASSLPAGPIGSSKELPYV